MIIEIFTAGFLIFWLGIGALIAMIVSFITNDLIVQTTIFIIFSTILIFDTRPFVNKFANNKTIPTNVSSLIGQTGIVTVDIDNVNSKGLVKVKGETWSANSFNNLVIPKNTQVEILKIDGVKLIVKPL